MYKIATYNQGREHKNQFNCHFSGNPDSQSPITFVLSILTGQAKTLHTITNTIQTGLSCVSPPSSSLSLRYIA